MNEVSRNTFVGAYEWKESGGTKAVEGDESEDIISPVGTGLAPRLVAYSTTRDGTKLYFSYPGNDMIQENISSLGKVAVMFDCPIQKYRLFYSAKQFKGKYAFKDVAVGDTSIEMVRQVKLDSNLRNENGAPSKAR